MKYMDVNEANWDDRKWYSKKIIFPDTEIWTPGAHVQEVKIKSWDTAKAHYHKIQTEIFYFLSDHGYWIINGERIKPKIGDTLMIQPHDMHTVVNDSEHDYIYMAFKLNYAQEDLYWEEDEIE